jgi:DNA polymerase III subunit epsilon
MFGWLKRLFWRGYGRDNGPSSVPSHCAAPAGPTRINGLDCLARSVSPRPPDTRAPHIGQVREVRTDDRAIAEVPAWFDHFPNRFAVVDVETTGIHHTDRIVSFAAICIERTALLQSQIPVRRMNLIFDPGKKCHPEAERVHGYTDWMLRHQQFFAEYANSISKLLEETDLLVAHNAEFDLDFLCREFKHAGIEPIRKPAFCTMNAYRQRFKGRANLDTVAARIGLARSGIRHGALEDCFLTLNVFLWLQGCPVRVDYSKVPFEVTRFENLRDVPPRPMGQLPPRKRRPRQRGSHVRPPRRSAA